MLLKFIVGGKFELFFVWGVFVFGWIDDGVGWFGFLYVFYEVKICFFSVLIWVCKKE